KSQFTACSGKIPKCLNEDGERLNFISLYLSIQLFGRSLWIHFPSSNIPSKSLILDLSFPVAVGSGLLKTKEPKRSILKTSPISMASYSFQFFGINIFLSSFYTTYYNTVFSFIITWFKQDSMV